MATCVGDGLEATRTTVTPTASHLHHFVRAKAEFLGKLVNRDGLVKANLVIAFPVIAVLGTWDIIWIFAPPARGGRI